MSKDYETGERWSLRNCEKAYSIAFTLGVAARTEPVDRMRKGVMVRGRLLSSMHRWLRSWGKHACGVKRTPSLR